MSRHSWASPQPGASTWPPSRASIARLSALKERVEAERTVHAATDGEAVDAKKIRASIDRLTALLERLEN